MGQFSAGLFDGGTDQFSDESQPELGGSIVSRLVVVSNRVALPRDRSARAGGLAVGVLSALKRARGLWLGGGGETSETPDAAPKIINSGGSSYATIDFTAAEFDSYYNGYCNSTLWPLLHYRLG